MIMPWAIDGKGEPCEHDFRYKEYGDLFQGWRHRRWCVNCGLHQDVELGQEFPNADGN